MPSIKYWFIVAIVATTLLTNVFAIQCYQCQSGENSKCGLRFEPEESMKIDCSSSKPPRHIRNALDGQNVEATGCMKQTMESTLGGIYIARSCYFGDLANKEVGCQLDPNNVLMKLDRCDVCTSDLCNASSTITPITILILCIFGLARLLS
ncbi:UPAR/Ly6 domain-containing protein bero-like [Musca autumnalis]|uniref:UPAR/Ly6 domain-containing protein bero-like n=1 Tax=Musca autumnalis TaxID=221902 RepID=UPI003CF6A293